MTPVTPSAPPDLSRQYPHVDAIADWRAQQSVRLLWDRVYDLEARLQGVTATQVDLTDASNQHETDLARVDRQSKEALAIAQATPPEAAILGGLSPGEPATGPGSKLDPIIPMSADPLVMEGNIKASLYHWNRADYSYWVGIVGTPWQGGDGKWYHGWDAYMEERARPGNAGFASHDLLPLPAVYTTVPPPGYPTGGWT